MQLSLSIHRCRRRPICFCIQWYDNAHPLISALALIRTHWFLNFLFFLLQISKYLFWWGPFLITFWASLASSIFCIHALTRDFSLGGALVHQLLPGPWSSRKTWQAAESGLWEEIEIQRKLTRWLFINPRLVVRIELLVLHLPASDPWSQLPWMLDFTSKEIHDPWWVLVGLSNFSFCLCFAF